MMLYLARTSQPSVVQVVPSAEEGAYHFEDAKGHSECPQFCMVRINGSIFFGAVDHVQRSLLQIDEINPQQKTVLVLGSGINFVDVAGAEMLAQEAKRRRKMGGSLYFYRLKEPVYNFLKQGHYLKDIGKDCFFPAKSNVISAIFNTLDPEICRNCKARIFKECQVAGAGTL
jgi:SulP family sulfate permease